MAIEGTGSLVRQEILLDEIDSLNYRNIYLIRQGETLLNKSDATGEHLTSGVSESAPLTEQGKQQAAALGLKLAQKIGKDQEIVICSSTALRAKQTAQKLFESLSPHFKCEMGGEYPGLVELGQGDWEGKPKDASYKQDLEKWNKLSAQEKLTAPKVSTGHSYQEVTERAMADLQKITDLYKNKIVLIVTHHNTMHALALRWSGCTLSREPRSILPPIDLDYCDMLMVQRSQGNIENCTVLAQLISKV